MKKNENYTSSNTPSVGDTIPDPLVILHLVDSVNRARSWPSVWPPREFFITSRSVEIETKEKMQKMGEVISRLNARLKSR